MPVFIMLRWMSVFIMLRWMPVFIRFRWTPVFMRFRWMPAIVFIRFRWMPIVFIRFRWITFFLFDRNWWMPVKKYKQTVYSGILSRFIGYKFCWILNMYVYIWIASNCYIYIYIFKSDISICNTLENWSEGLKFKPQHHQADIGWSLRKDLNQGAKQIIVLCCICEKKGFISILGSLTLEML